MSVCAIRDTVRCLLAVPVRCPHGRMPTKFSPQEIMKMPKDYVSPFLEIACVYVAMSRVIPVYLQRPFREEKER